MPSAARLARQPVVAQGRRAPNRRSLRCSDADPRGQPAPSPAELPVHYIQVQVVGPRVQHAQALGPQVGQVAVEDGRADLAARRHGAGSLERVSPREPGPAKTPQDTDARRCLVRRQFGLTSTMAWEETGGLLSITHGLFASYKTR